jgi:hypothetical protein
MKICSILIVRRTTYVFNVNSMTFRRHKQCNLFQSVWLTVSYKAEPQRQLRWKRGGHLTFTVTNLAATSTTKAHLLKTFKVL